MRTSKYLLYTKKQIPKNVTIISHKLMLKAGLIKQSNAGLYIWLPIGLKVLHNIKQIIREEMNKIGAIEICFPILQTEHLWHKSNRFKEYGEELIKLHDRHNQGFVLGPTYEEMVTEFIKQEIKTYKKLPIILYQIQAKFRDEKRPRSGIMRAREFIMKDAYSFHENQESLQKTYVKMYQAYNKIFNKIHLKFYSVQASSGLIGGNISHEFQALSPNGEDKIIISKNYEKKSNEINNSIKKFQKKKYFYNKTIIQENEIYQKTENDLKKFFKMMKKKIIKIFIIEANYKNKLQYIGLMIRGDNLLDSTKIININHITIKNKRLVFVNKKEINSIINKNEKINLSIPLIIDTKVALLNNIIPMVIINDIFFTKKTLNQNFNQAVICNIRNNCNSSKNIKNCIEIGHIFQIGKKYSKIINATIQDKNGLQKFIDMGCYGIGVTRLISAIIEQNHDKNGIIWPNIIAPFQLLIIPIDIHKCDQIKKISEKLYYTFKNKKVQVLFEDRNERTSKIFAESNLIGIPHIVIINRNTIDYKIVEYQSRKRIKQTIIINIQDITDFILQKIQNN